MNYKIKSGYAYSLIYISKSKSDNIHLSFIRIYKCVQKNQVLTFIPYLQLYSCKYIHRFQPVYPQM